MFAVNPSTFRIGHRVLQVQMWTCCAPNLSNAKSKSRGRREINIYSQRAGGIIGYALPSSFAPHGDVSQSGNFAASCSIFSESSMNTRPDGSARITIEFASHGVKRHRGAIGGSTKEPEKKKRRGIFRLLTFASVWDQRRRPRISNRFVISIPATE